MQPGHPQEATSPRALTFKPAAPAPLTQVSGVLTPAEVYQTAVEAAVYKHRAPLPKLFLMGIASGLCEWEGRAMVVKLPGGALLAAEMVEAPPLPG